MRPFWATPADPHDPTGIHPTLNDFAAECAATLTRLMAYVGVLGLLAMAGLHFWDELPDAAPEPAAKAGWSLALRRILPSPSARSICQIKQRLMRFSGIPKEVVRTFCTGALKDRLWAEIR